MKKTDRKKTIRNKQIKTKRRQMPEIIDETPLTQEISEVYRDTVNKLDTPPPKTTANQSQAEDRSEDLINETDPFIQQPEKNTQIPPELLQDKSDEKPEEEDLTSLFEHERKVRQHRDTL